jgi:hypothetical protein
MNDFWTDDAVSTFDDSSENAILRLLSHSIFASDNTTDTDETNSTFNGSTSTANNDVGDDTGRDAYEFVAFLLWYLFLVLCCILPTCCAYRRRRLIETQLQQQQATFEQQLQLQNVFILNNLGQLVGHRNSNNNSEDNDTNWNSSEEARVERTKRIAEALGETTFVRMCVLDGCIVLLFSNAITDVLIRFLQTVTEKDIITKNEEGAEEIKVTETRTVTALLDEELGIAVMEDSMDSTLLKLPPRSNSNTNTTTNTPLEEQMLVSGGCAICLCAYEAGDKVSFSPHHGAGEVTTTCQHAFHHECILPWLGKKQETKCPCCRQDFCIVEPVRMTTAHQLQLPHPLNPSRLPPYANNAEAVFASNHPFGMIPTVLLEQAAAAAAAQHAPSRGGASTNTATTATTTIGRNTNSMRRGRGQSNNNNNTTRSSSNNHRQEQGARTSALSLRRSAQDFGMTVINLDGMSGLGRNATVVNMNATIEERPAASDVSTVVPASSSSRAPPAPAPTPAPPPPASTSASSTHPTTADV